MKKTLKFFALLTLIICVFFGILACENTSIDGKSDNNIDNNDDNEEPESFKISAMDFVSNMGVGWNLGDTLDAPANYSSSTTLSNLETIWVKVTTTEDLIKAVKDAGFTTIRIPVSWKKAADPNNNYAIRFDWLYRVQEIVDYAIDNDMYVILNTHHDSDHSSPAPIFKFDNEANTAASIEAFIQIWE